MHRVDNDMANFYFLISNLWQENTEKDSQEDGKFVVICLRDDIPNKPFGNYTKIGFETDGCARFYLLTKMRE